MSKLYPEKFRGYWKRSDHQYWHIKSDSALLINIGKEGFHYNGDAHIFFEGNESSVYYAYGRVRITRKEFEEVKREHLSRLNDF